MRSAPPSASKRERRRRNYRGRAPNYVTRSRISRESGSHDGRSVRRAAAAGGAGLSPPPGDAARGAVDPHRGGARGAAAPGLGDPSPAALGCGHRGRARAGRRHRTRSEEHTSELQSRLHLVCRLLLEKKKKPKNQKTNKIKE